MLTREEYTGILQEILETGGLTDSMEENVKKLVDDFDEREGMLAKYNEDSDKETETEDYKVKYEELYSKYMNRFFAKGGEPVNNDEKQDEPTEDEVTIEKLLYNEED